MDFCSITFGKRPLLALAPMAGYTDIAFRELIASSGADLVYSELASATALARGQGEKTRQIIAVSPHGATGIQLFTSSPQDMAKTVRELSSQISSGECGAKFIDINLGCPAPKVVKNGAGSALLNSPEKLRQVVSAAVRASTVPVSAKTRTGYRQAQAAEVAKMLEDEGVCAITMHGRTAHQKFSGKADWAAIKSAVEAVSIPVLGNGDVHCAEDAIRMEQTTGCAGVMIGRAALSNPLVFAQTRALLGGGEYSKTTISDKVKFLQQYSALCRKYRINFGALKGLAIQLCSEERGAARARGSLNGALDEEALFAALASIG